MRRLCIILGAPLWLTLLIALVAVTAALCLSLWAVLVSLVGSTLGSIVLSAVSAVRCEVLPCLTAIGTMLICSGLSIFLFCGSRLATGRSILLTKKLFCGIHGCLTR